MIDDTTVEKIRNECADKTQEQKWEYQIRVEH